MHRHGGRSVRGVRSSRGRAGASLDLGIDICMSPRRAPPNACAGDERAGARVWCGGGAGRWGGVPAPHSFCLTFSVGTRKRHATTSPHEPASMFAAGCASSPSAKVCLVASYVAKKRAEVGKEPSAADPSPL
jgi:hypothetical protein